MDIKWTSSRVGMPNGKPCASIHVHGVWILRKECSTDNELETEEGKEKKSVLKTWSTAFKKGHGGLEYPFVRGLSPTVLIKIPPHLSLFNSFPSWFFLKVLFTSRHYIMVIWLLSFFLTSMYWYMIQHTGFDCFTCSIYLVLRTGSSTQDAVNVHWRMGTMTSQQQ